MLADRMRLAAIGTGISLLPIAVMAFAQIRYVPQMVRNSGFDPRRDEWIVTQVETDLSLFYLAVSGILTAYWMCAAWLGRGDILRIRSANSCLAASILGLAVWMTYWSLLSDRNHSFESICSALGIADDYPDFIFDGRSECDVFLMNTIPIALFVSVVILFLASAILRILVSRHATRAI